jgi:hypothetical protein
LGSGSVETSLSGSDKVVENILDRLYGRGLDGILVVEKSKTSVGFTRVGDAKIDEFQDNGFENVVGSVLESFSTSSDCSPARLTIERPPRGSRKLAAGIARFQGQEALQSANYR